ncbi:MAG TPA: YhjD/YihY/BrkB family envelope integrity protein, partial [Solirubrobacterales bacterium]|nr:YhjD/YihY/BrkB family envelope integrity protein [Solirubrobacterales bacterium]
MTGSPAQRGLAPLARPWRGRAEESRRARVGGYLRAFWHRAYVENITGLAGMVAYNLVLVLFPFALLVLFIFGRILQSAEVETSVLNDLQRLFPAVEMTTLNNALDRIRDSSTTIGVAAVIAAIWLGTSFWGAMDTAFCRIYHVECRGWLEQKRFALGMLLVVTLFLAASVVIPTLEGLLTSS